MKIHYMKDEKPIWEEWKLIVRQAASLMEDQEIARIIREILDKGGKETAIASFIFTIKREVMEEIVALYSRRTEKGNGLYWQRPFAEGIPDWS